MIKAERIAAADLAKDPTLVGLWRDLQRAQRVTRNPFFAPEFTIAVGRIRDDAQVAVLRGAKDRVVGFLPFQGARNAWPIGYPFSDHHGALLAAGLDFEAPDLLRAVGLESFDFRHLPAEQELFQQHFGRVRTSPVIEFDRFELRNAEGRKRRKIERELGPLRFEPQATSREVLEQLFRWKSAWCRSAGVPDVFREGWIRLLVGSLVEVREDEFRGQLSALYAGDRLVAAHMGPRSPAVWHWWFPTYDGELAAYSPGLLMLLHMIEDARAQGTAALDFGSGREAFKRRFANGGIPVADGAVALSRTRQLRYQAKRLLRASIAGTRLEAPVRRLRRAVRRR